MNRRRRRARQREQVAARSAYIASGAPKAEPRQVPAREERRKAERDRIALSRRVHEYQRAKL